jgi:hypothetical protein
VAPATSLAGLASGDGFHTNFGVLNLDLEPLTVRYDVHAADGRLLGDFTITAAAGGFAQYVDAVADLSTEDLRGAWAEVSCAGEASYLTYASVVDDASHDPTFIPPNGVDAGAELLWVPVAAANGGLAGTRWLTTLDLLNLNETAAATTLTFLPADGSEGIIVERELPAGGALHSPDVVRDLFELGAASGWIQVEATAPLHGACRIFNNADTGTFGQHVPVLTEADAFAPGSSLLLPSLRSDAGFRTNVGATSFADVDGALEITFYTDEGDEVGTTTVNLPAGAFVQLVEVLTTEHAYEGSAWASVSTDNAGGPVAVHASVIDGATGDPSFINAKVAPTEIP